MPLTESTSICKIMHESDATQGTDKYINPPTHTLPALLMRQGDSPASEFYVLEEGTCEVWVQTNATSKAKKALVYAPGRYY